VLAGLIVQFSAVVTEPVVVRARTALVDGDVTARRTGAVVVVDATCRPLRAGQVTRRAMRVAGRWAATLSLDADHIRGVLYNAGSTVFCAVQQRMLLT
jgi:hypothetical protein